jgi:hypothetical protein
LPNSLAVGRLVGGQVDPGGDRRHQVGQAAKRF